MSAYGKSQPPNLHGEYFEVKPQRQPAWIPRSATKKPTAFDSARSFSESNFTFVPPSYGSQPSAASSIAAPNYHNPTSQMTQMSYPSNQGKPATYEDQSGPYLNVGSTPVPQVIAYSPSRGSQGTKIFVDITSLYELQTTDTPIFYLVFGRQKCGASLSKLTQQGGVCSYRVATEAPQFAATRWSSTQVPVSLFMETGDGDVIAKVDVGGYTYDNGQSNVDDQQQDSSRKRKFSTDSSELMKSPLKRVSSQIRPKEEFPTYGYASADTQSPYSPYLQSGGSYNLMPQYNRPQASYQQHPASRQIGYGGYPSSATDSSPTIKGESPQVSSWSPAFPGMGPNLARSPEIAQNVVQPRAGLTSLPSPSIAANPPLIRTSTLQTLQQSPSPAGTPHIGTTAHQYNAYSLYSQKAVLEIMGDLDSMAQHWSEEEVETRRRLVHFRRAQSGSTITTTFQPISIDERPPQSCCISCIYWEEKDECFVTSVDTISLLEHLVAARFTVEEKNRIRRNLEGFRPLTVSKANPDSEEFFKVVMAFPAPKPRNIEKDVKVFHWKDLSSALKKIISKYSASPSSTLPPPSAPALLTPVSSTGYTTDSGGAMSYVGDHNHAASTTQNAAAIAANANSPRSLPSSTTATPYTSNMPARVPTPVSQKPLLQNTPSDLRVSVPLTHPHAASTHWQGGPPQQQQTLSQQQQHQQYQHQLSAQSARASWDLSAYLDSNPTSAGGTSSNPNTHHISNATAHGQTQSQIQGQTQSQAQGQTHTQGMTYPNPRNTAEILRNLPPKQSQQMPR